MSNNKQPTAVEQFAEQLASKNLLGIHTYGEMVMFDDLLNQFKEMEKVNQKYFFDCGRQYQLTGEGTFNQVYNETYGGNK